MKQRIPYLLGLLAVGLLFVGVILAQKPTPNIDHAKNPALSDAQHHVIEAYEKVEESQKHWKDQLGGHAEKAKQLLEQASKELKEAADYVDSHPNK